MKKTVVLVEDRPGLREQFVRILADASDIECLYTVNSAEEALEKIPQRPPDVVLLDIKLPGMSGIDCVPLLKAKLPELEILILTIYEEEDIIFRALKAGANGYLLKSSSPEALFGAIRDVYAGGSAFSSNIARKVVHYFQSAEKPAKSPDSEKLSPRELELLELLAVGFSNKEIADKMQLSLETVRTYVKRIYSKMHVRNRTEAAIKHYS
ncbi:MAG: response regulator transcription factor [Verrucomicrobiales bacterium]|jgi:DNA-binding NarL/FixJ family response regulator|nr:response regulator transcription factor [Verrucomicrobiales bacterium]